jgi:hypothetical protein
VEQILRARNTGEVHIDSRVHGQEQGLGRFVSETLRLRDLGQFT